MPAQWNALVIGQGSIGVRHARILERIGCDVISFSRRNADGSAQGARIEQVVAKKRPDYIVIATETASHIGNLRAIAKSDYDGLMLIEKPLFEQPYADVRPKPRSIFVGYQLRFHGAVQALRAFVRAQKCISATFYVGQYLDSWREGRGGKTTYSGHAAMGGGVLRDLSHELDLAHWLFGACSRVCAAGGKLGDVTVDSDDAWGILADFERCPIVSLQLNYFDRPGRRRILVVGEELTADIDLVAGTVKIGDSVERFEHDRDAPIEAMHRSVLEKNGENACDFDGGQRVLAMIDAIERAGRERTWVTV
jgi:predicted dehydrogenase